MTAAPIEKLRIRRRVGGVEFVVSTSDAAVRALPTLVAAAKAGGIHVHFGNAYTVAMASRAPEVAHVLATGVVFPDGKPVSWVSRLRRDRPVLQQVRGPGFFDDVIAADAEQPLKHFLLGSRPDVLEALQARMREISPDIQIVGAISPPFRQLTTTEEAEQDSQIAASGADVLWVGLGTPRQDLEGARIAGTVPVVAVAIGAAFDYLAGTLREAPPWIRRAGLEWLFRFAVEPRRLWRRYLIGNLQFLVAVARSK